MSTPFDIYAQLEQRFAGWALDQPAIQAVIVVGSQARSDHLADEWSDLDLVIFATTAASYLHDASWLRTFGNVIAAVSNSFGSHDREWIALYADGSKLDAAFLSIDPAAPALQALLDVFPYPTVLQRGIRVLLDKTGSRAELRLPKLDTPQLPDQAEFIALVNRMWLDAIKTAKFIRRHDLWRAKQLCDGELKQHLLTMLEWHAAVQSDQREIWYDGRFMAEWADREALTALPATFAAYHPVDMKRALLATLDLFRRLARFVAGQLHYPYPIETDQFSESHIHTLLR